MSSAMKTVIYPVKDLEQAKALYGALLGVEPSADAPYYVGYDVPDLHVGLDPNGHAQGMTGPVCFWHVDDINASVEAFVAAGGTVAQPARDVGGGRLVATVEDDAGNRSGFIQG